MMKKITLLNFEHAHSSSKEYLTFDISEIERLGASRYDLVMAGSNHFEYNETEKSLASKALTIVFEGVDFYPDLLVAFDDRGKIVFSVETKPAIKTSVARHLGIGGAP
jgi:hypothetical protein